MIGDFDTQTHCVTLTVPDALKNWNVSFELSEVSIHKKNRNGFCGGRDTGLPFGYIRLCLAKNRA